MRICFVTSTFPRYKGDTRGVFVYRLAKVLLNRGLQVRVAAPGDVGALAQEEFDGIEVNRFSYWFPATVQRVAYGEGIPVNLRKSWLARLQLPFFILAFLFQIAWAIRDCDVVHTHWAPCALIAWLAQCLTFQKRPIVLTVHGTDLRGLSPRFSRWILKRTNRVISTSDEMSELVIRLGRSEFDVINLPVDETVFHPTIAKKGLRAKLGIPRDAQVVTFVGRLDDFKDPLTFVRSIPYVLDQMPSTHFLLVGYGPLQDKVNSLVCQSSIQRYVTLTGQRSDVSDLLSLSTLFVATSPVENAWSMTIVEAMFMHVPCVIGDAGRGKVFFKHLENCYQVPSGDANALASGIVAMLRSSELREQIAEGASRLLREHRRLDAQIADAHLDLYNELLS